MADDSATSLNQRAAKVLRMINPIMLAVLRSPLHGLLSGKLVVLSVKGRKTGREYTFPVGYRLDGGEVKIVSSQGWWRNLREADTPVTVWLKGERREGLGQAFHGDDVVAAELPAFLAQSPSLGKLYGIERDGDGHYKAESVRDAAGRAAVARIRLS